MKTHTLFLTALLSASIALASEVNIANPTDIGVKQEGMKYIKMLGGTLKSELQTHMKADKTGLAAMGFCTAQADNITKEINAKLPKYASVRRTAMKTRNQNNAADALDQKVMAEYEASIAAKTFLPADIKVVEEGDTTRVYKPLVTKGVCLKCHGTDISKEIQGEIKTHYPKDQAIGFKQGSLRGVIVAEIKKQP
jgi:hypothetical protein